MNHEYIPETDNELTTTHPQHHIFYHQHDLYPSKPNCTRPNKRDLDTFTTPDRKPFLFGLKTTIDKQEINILLDPGSTITMMSKNLEAKLDHASLESRGSKTLLLTAAAECSKRCHSKMTSLCIPTKEGNVEISGFLINKTLAKITPQDLLIFKQDWPNLSEDIRHDIESNKISGPVDIIIGQDNLWRLVLAGIVVHPSEDFAFGRPN